MIVIRNAMSRVPPQHAPPLMAPPILPQDKIQFGVSNAHVLALTAPHPAYTRASLGEFRGDC